MFTVTQYLEKYYPQLILRVTEKINGKLEEPGYLNKSLLATTKSITGSWMALLGDHSRVSADYVAMDSYIPLKLRDSMQKVTGDIPKSAIKMQMNEKQMDDLNILMNSINADETEIVKRIFNDTQRCIYGIEERNEITFLQGLSEGVALTAAGETPDNVGTGVRLNYGFLDEHKFGVEVLDLTKIVEDIARVKKDAEEFGSSIRYMYTDPVTFAKLSQVDAFRQLFGFTAGFVGTNIPAPSTEAAKNVIKSWFGIDEVIIVNRVAKTERDGKRTSIRPWKEGMIVFTANKTIGENVWADLPESLDRSKTKLYGTANTYTLTSFWHQDEPYGNFSMAQARVVPVINDVYNIFHLDTKTIQA